MKRLPDQKRNARRRWWQFRLRTLLIGLTLVSVLLAVWGVPLSEYYREQQIVAPIEAAGGRVSRRYVPRTGSSILSMVVGSRPYMRVTEIEYAALGTGEDFEQLYRLPYLCSLSLAGVPIEQDMLLDVRKIENLQVLNLSGTGITDAGLLALKGHPNLVRLNVAKTPVTDAALVELESLLPHMEKLLRQRAVDELMALGCNIQPSSNPFEKAFNEVQLNSAVAPGDLRHLRQLPHLNSIQAMNVSFTDEAVKHIAAVPSLRSLRVSNGKWPSVGLQTLSELTELRSLRLEWIPVEDKDLVDIGEFRELNELCLDGSRVTGQGFCHLQTLKNLTQLNLDSVQNIYDVDLEALYPLKNLRTLVVPTARISPTGVERLQEAIPGLRVTGPKPRRYQVPGGPPADYPEAVRAAFWSGDYGGLQQYVEAEEGPRDWEHCMWLGHARQLADDWPGALAAYKEALELLDQACNASSGQREREQLTKQWSTLVLLAGRAQLELLNDIPAAIETLGKGIRFAPAADRPISVLAEEAAKRIDGLSSPHKTREVTGQLWSDLMYPLTAHRYLALAHEKAGDNAAALTCWTRIRLCKLAYRAAMSETEASHLAQLWASLDDAEPLPDTPVFTVVSGGEQVTKLEPTSGQSRVTCWESNAWDGFSLVPTPGSAIASLSFECVPCEKAASAKSTLTCWTGAVGRHNSRSQVLLDEPIIDFDTESGQAHASQVGVPLDHDVLFVGMENLESVTIRAMLRRRTGANEAPKQAPSTPRAIASEKIVFEASPFRCVDDQSHEPINQPFGGTSVARLADGQFIMAYGHDTIEIAASRDGKTWEDPIAFPHNTVFPTRSPAFCVDDLGVLWMVYLSKRPGYDIHSSGRYCPYRTSSRDGRTWSQPKPILPRRLFQYQEVSHLMRAPDGGFRFLLSDQMAVAASPDQLSTLLPLYIPVREQWVPSQTHIAADDQGRWHAVYVDSYGQVHYSYADWEGTWRVNTRLEEVQAMHVHTPQLVLEGDRLALLYWTNQGLWLHRGRLTENGPQLGPAEQIMNHRFDGHGARLMRIDGEVYLPLPARPPLLLRATLEDLL